MQTILLSHSLTETLSIITIINCKRLQNYINILQLYRFEKLAAVLAYLQPMKLHSGLLLIFERGGFLLPSGSMAGCLGLYQPALPLRRAFFLPSHRLYILRFFLAPNPIFFQCQVINDNRYTRNFFTITIRHGAA